MEILNQYTVTMTKLTDGKFPLTFGTHCILRTVGHLSRSVINSSSGQTGSSLYTASVTGPASRWCSSRCSSFGAPGRCPLQHQLSLLGTNETSSIRGQCPVRKDGSLPSARTVASLKSRQLRPTMVFYWCFMKCSTSSKSQRQSKRGLLGSKES